MGKNVKIAQIEGDARDYREIIQQHRDNIRERLRQEEENNNVIFPEVKRMILMSTILARAARLRGWETDDLEKQPKKTLEEIQCMSIDGRIYIAGNHGDAELVKEFLNAFGVTNRVSFIKCLIYTHWVLSNGHELTEFKTENGIVYTGQELIATQLTNDITEFNISESGKREAAAILGTANSDERVEELLQGKTQMRNLGWFLRKLSGLKGSETRNASFRKAKGCVGNHDAIGVCVLKDETETHAELKLLAHLAKLALKDESYRNKNVFIGGLKAACRHCKNWIERYQKWIWYEFNIRIRCINLIGDNRTHGSGAGSRPQFASADLALLNHGGNSKPLARLLFNGKPNNNWDELDTAFFNQFRANLNIVNI